MEYSWQRSSKVYLDEDEQFHTVMKIWFKDDGRMDGQLLSGSEEDLNNIEGELADLLEQSFSVSADYLFMSKGDLVDLMDKAEIVNEGDDVRITAKDVLVEGDEVHFTIDKSTKLLQSIKLSSVVMDKSFTRSMSFNTIGDGTMYPDQSVLEIPSESLKEIVETIQVDKKDEYDATAFKTLGPMVGHALLRGQLFKAACELTEPDADIMAVYYVKIPMSEGYYVTANIFRSKEAAEKGEKVPVIMCAHHYDNHLTPALGNTPMNGAPQQYRMIPQAGKPKFSKLTSWESPDPNF